MNPYSWFIDEWKGFEIMFDTSNQMENAASLHTAGAIVSVVNPEDPRNPIMYMAGNQDISQGVVHLDMTSDSRLRLAAKQDAKIESPKANKKYAALEALSKPGQNAATMQMRGMNKYAALHAGHATVAQNRAALRTVKAPEPKTAPQPKVAVAQPVAAAPTVSMSVGQLHMRKDQKPELVASNDRPKHPSGSGFYRRHNQLMQMACALG